MRQLVFNEKRAGFRKDLSILFEDFLNKNGLTVVAFAGQVFQKYQSPIPSSVSLTQAFYKFKSGRGFYASSNLPSGYQYSQRELGYLYYLFKGLSLKEENEFVKSLRDLEPEFYYD